MNLVDLVDLVDLGMSFAVRSAGALAISFLSLTACGKQNTPGVSRGIMAGVVGGQTVGAPKVNPPLPGIGKTHIIGGQPVNAGDEMSHSVVALYDMNAKALCTASIVSPNYLITAAHCVTPGKTSGLRVIFGTDATNQATVKGISKVLAAVQSPAWKTNQNNNTNTGDIAIVRLASPLPDGYGMATIIRDPSLLQDNTTVMLEGYGITTGHPDPNSPDDSGAGVLRAVVTKITNAHFSESEVLIDNSQGKGACHGDSGGPAYIRDAQGGILLFGVTSRGTDEFCSQGVVYTNILAYLNWIPTAVTELEAQVKGIGQTMMPHLAGN